MFSSACSFLSLRRCSKLNEADDVALVDVEEVVLLVVDDDEDVGVFVDVVAFVDIDDAAGLAAAGLAEFAVELGRLALARFWAMASKRRRSSSLSLRASSASIFLLRASMASLLRSSRSLFESCLCELDFDDNEEDDDDADEEDEGDDFDVAPRAALVELPFDGAPLTAAAFVAVPLEGCEGLVEVVVSFCFVSEEAEVLVPRMMAGLGGGRRRSVISFARSVG